VKIEEQKTLARAIVRLLNEDFEEYETLARKISGDCPKCGATMVKAKRKSIGKIKLCTNCKNEIYKF